MFNLFKIFIVASLILSASASQANQVLEVLTESWAPFNYEDSGKITGYSTEVVEAVLQEVGIPFQIRMGVWTGIYQKALDEPNQLIYTISRIPKREDKFNWIGPIADRQQALYKLKQREDIQVDTLEDVKKYRLVLQESDSTTAFFLNNGFSTDNDRFSLTDKPVRGLKMLMADYVDLIPLHPLSLRYKLTEQELGDTELEKVLDLPVEGAYYMAYSLGTDPALIKRTRQAFAKLQKDGTIESIRIRYRE